MSDPKKKGSFIHLSNIPIGSKCMDPFVGHI